MVTCESILENHTTVHTVSCGCGGFLTTTPLTSGLLRGCGYSDNSPCLDRSNLASKLDLGKKRTILFCFIYVPRVSWLVSQNLIKTEYEATGLASSEQKVKRFGPHFCRALPALITGTCARAQYATLNESLSSLGLAFLRFQMLVGLTG